ncbi:E7 protein [Bos taurus papillomavirus 18]|uniref:Protein E7 n=1 Tax=Bos taurus papillomavirus 18 TaxID=1887216 RepID=A0A1B2K279_9PAPI|nr:E7 protein [Bos taurus papillomavirus 18]ANZ90245.1 E7 protein [Bos taurus papillomavirus 18]
MIGTSCTLHDIVLQEQPDIANLQCHEQIDDIEEEVEPKHFYKILIECGHCKNPLKLIVKASAGQIQNFHQLLLDDFDLICAVCQRNHL